MRRSRRAKQLRIDVHADGRVVVTRPLRVSQARAETFVKQKLPWIKLTLTSLRRARRKLGLEYRPAARHDLSAAEYKNVRDAAHRLVKERIAHYGPAYGVSVGRVFIRDQRTRWGSCSTKGNLNFNWRIVHLPPQAADYLIVHELCHLREFNHSERFWRLVARAVPDYVRIRKELRALPL
jgi:predicted metal-dependent hydrolase